MSIQTPVSLGIALEGKGSYGAYTKGILQTLFRHPVFNAPERLRIKAVTGTSSGAMNGALITAGLNSGGPEEANRLLDSCWRSIGTYAALGSLMNPFNLVNLFENSTKWPNLPPGTVSLMKAQPKGFIAGQLKSRMEEHIMDWEAIRNGPVRLFVNAVHQDQITGKRSHMTFSGKDLSPNAIAASGANPQFGPHIINGETFYDGACMRNPCFHDIKHAGISDLLVITLSPFPKEGVITPRHQDQSCAAFKNPGQDMIGEEIHNHLAWLSEHHPELNLHVISLIPEEYWEETSAMNAEPAFLNLLEKRGEEDAEMWLKNGAAALGKRSSYSPARTENEKMVISF